MSQDVSRYRLEQADRHFSELREIMDPENVQIAHAWIEYLSSVEFFALVALILGYRLLRKRLG